MHEQISQIKILNKNQAPTRTLKCLWKEKPENWVKKKFPGLIAPNNIINKNSCNIQAK